MAGIGTSLPRRRSEHSKGELASGTAVHCCLAHSMSRSSSPDSVHEPLGEADWPQRPRWLSRTRSMIDYARQFVADNLGLLLVLASQMFFSIMNVVVKQLHSIDTPISTFQVSVRENLGIWVLNLLIRSLSRGWCVDFLTSVVCTDCPCALGDYVYLFVSLHVSRFLLCYWSTD
jgi:hypothetical protein